MSLTTEQLRLRDGKLTASRVSCLMSGDAAKILALWQEMIGDPDYVAEDLSGVWPVQLGTATEAVNLEFYTRQTGHPLTRHGEVVVCPAADWAASTLDAWDTVVNGPVDAKHVGGYEPREKVRDRYTPQMFWQMICTGARWSALSIIEGAKPPVIEEVAWDEAYAAELWRRAEAFMACVESLTPPVEMAPVAAPVPITKWRQFDLDAMQENDEAWPNWAYVIQSDLYSWKETAAYAKSNARATKAIKDVLPEDVSRLTHAGVIVTRSKTGAVTIKEKED